MLAVNHTEQVQGQPSYQKQTELASGIMRNLGLDLSGCMFLLRDLHSSQHSGCDGMNGRSSMASREVPKGHAWQEMLPTLPKQGELHQAPGTLWYTSSWHPVAYKHLVVHYKLQPVGCSHHVVHYQVHSSRLRALVWSIQACVEI